MRIDRPVRRKRMRFLPARCPNCRDHNGPRCYGATHREEGVFFCCACKAPLGRQIGRTLPECLKLLHLPRSTNRDRLAKIGWTTAPVLKGSVWTARERKAVLSAFKRKASERELMELLPNRSSYEIRSYWRNLVWRRRNEEAVQIAYARHADKQVARKQLRAKLVELQDLPATEVAARLRLTVKSVGNHRSRMGLTRKPRPRLRFASGGAVPSGVLGVLQRMAKHDLTVLSNHVHNRIVMVLLEHNLVSARVIPHPVPGINRTVMRLRINQAGRTLVAGQPDVPDPEIGARVFYVPGPRGGWVRGQNSSIPDKSAGYAFPILPVRGVSFRAVRERCGGEARA